MISLLLFLLFCNTTIDSSNSNLEGITNNDAPWSGFKTIGIVQQYWTNWGIKHGIDSLRETVFLTYAKKELEAKGYSVYFIEPVNLFETKDTVYNDNTAIELKTNRPDMVLMATCRFDSLDQKKSVTIGFDLTFQPPEYHASAWAGAIHIKSNKGFQIADDNAEYIVKRIFNEHFKPKTNSNLNKKR